MTETLSNVAWGAAAVACTAAAAAAANWTRRHHTPPPTPPPPSHVRIMANQPRCDRDHFYDQDNEAS